MQVHLPPPKHHSTKGQDDQETQDRWYFLLIYIPSATKLSEMYDQSKRSEKKDTTTRVDAAEDEEAANLL